jgi:glutamate--cysteine ligase catalytic subunit
MGLLSEGKPLKWEDAKNYADHVRNNGIEQFIIQWNKNKDRCGDNLKWGDEVLDLFRIF